MGIKGFLYFIISAYLVFTVYLIIYNLNTGEVEFNTIIFQQNTGNGALPPAVVDPHTVLDETEEAVVPVWKERAAAGWAPTKTKKEEEIIEQFLDTASNKYVPEFVLNQPEACKGANSSSVIVVVPTSFSNHRSR